MKNSKKNIIIAGAGDVGKNLAKVIKGKYNIYFIDRKLPINIPDRPVEILHICFPYNNHFIKNATSYIKKYRPRLTIINATVAVGTTRQIMHHTKSPAVLHSPVIGDHNKLAQGILTFKKAIGAESRYYAQRASVHFNQAGIKTVFLGKPEVTELGKLLLTTQFALNIAFHQEMERMCQKENIDYTKTIKCFKQIFNEGYEKIRPNVIMPNLFPGKIEGSCLMQNIEILKTFYQSDFFSAIKKSNNKKKK